VNRSPIQPDAEENIMMRRTVAAGLGGLALFMVVCCSSKNDDNKGTNGGATGATPGFGGGVLFTGGSGGAVATGGTDSGLKPCDIAKSLPNCTASSTSATLRTVNMLIVLDKSGSMGKPGLGSSTSKWDAMKTALGTALNKAKLTISFGLDLFPKADVVAACTGDTCCSTPAVGEALNVPVGPGADTVPTILSTLAATTPGGGTPMAAALSRALDYYVSGDGFGLNGDKYVLLVTDGGPNCDTAAVPTCDAPACTRNLDPDPNCNLNTNCCSTAALAVNCLDDASVNTEIQALATAGIKTIVVGIPGSDPYVPYLNAFAQAGQKPNTDPNATTAYYAVAESAGSTGLAQTLQSITIDLVKSCVITYTKPPDDPELVNVLVDCAIIPREPTDGGDGSYWTLDMTTSTITLGGAICDKILAQGVNRVDYVFGCPRPPE
jgi:hypothetical protein